MNRRNQTRTRHQDLLEAADHVLALPEAGALATEMALRDASIARWTLRSQCVLQLQEQQLQKRLPGFAITELGTREGWARLGRVPVKNANRVYIFSEPRRERGSFPVFDRSQTRPTVPGRDRPRAKRPDPARTWMRTLQRGLESCGFSLQCETGEHLEIGTEEQQLILTAPDHYSPAALAVLAQHCAGLALASSTGAPRAT